MIFANVISLVIREDSIFNMMKKPLITMMIMTMLGFTLSACSSDSVMAPKPFGMTGPERDAPEAYLAGWDDGCQTGMSTMSTTYYKSFYSYDIDHHMMDNPEYYRAWRDAYTYCRHYVFKSVWDGSDKMNNAFLDTKICVFCY